MTATGSLDAAKLRSLPICVDLDGTLIVSDLLFENIARMMRVAPWRLPLIPVWLLAGRAALKTKLAQNAPLDPAALPYRQDLVDYLRTEKAAGRQIVLASASDRAQVEAIAAHLGIFDAVHASDGVINLKSKRKADALAAAFPDGFVYAGNCAVDLAVWQQADGAIVAGCPSGVVRRIDKPVEASFVNPPLSLKTLVRLARVHHWLKNTLLFLPMFLGRDFAPEKILICIAGFLVFSMVASTSYIANDLVDLPSDRRHRTKRLRPLAAGTVPVAWGLAAVPAFYLAGIIAAYLLRPAFCGAVLAYLAITTFYSAVLKSRPLLDVICLGVLFTIRIYMGIVLLQQAISPWLLMFSLSFFCGLSFIKRAAEVLNSPVEKNELVPGRGYRPDDIGFITTFGIATAMLSIVVFILYIANDQYPRDLYRHPSWLWLVPLPLFYFNGHLWFETLRRRMNEDPVSYAVKDASSWAAFVIMLLAVLLAY